MEGHHLTLPDRAGVKNYQLASSARPLKITKTPDKLVRKCPKTRKLELDMLSSMLKQAEDSQSSKVLKRLTSTHKTVK